MFGKQQPREDLVPQRPVMAGPPAPFQACCCPAWPAVMVVMPPRPGRDHPVDLWLCRHHYRASQAALLAAGATIVDLRPAEDESPVSHAATLA